MPIFKVGQKVLHSKSHAGTTEHQIGEIVGIIDIIEPPNSYFYLVKVGNIITTIQETELVRILKWKDIGGSSQDPFYQNSGGTTHYYNEENDWILIRYSKQELVRADYFMYIAKDENNIMRYKRRCDVASCNPEGWV